MGLHNQHSHEMCKLIYWNSGTDMACLQFHVKLKLFLKNETDNKAFLFSVVWW